MNYNFNYKVLYRIYSFMRMRNYVIIDNSGFPAFKINLR